MDFPNNRVDQMYNNFLNFINVASFLIGLENLELNITANDLDSQTNAILEDLHTYFDEQNKHLALQDAHLAAQDERLDKLEKMLAGTKPYDRKESER